MRCIGDWSNLYSLDNPYLKTTLTEAKEMEGLGKGGGGRGGGPVSPYPLFFLNLDTLPPHTSVVHTNNLPHPPPPPPHFQCTPQPLINMTYWTPSTNNAVCEKKMKESHANLCWITNNHLYSDPIPKNFFFFLTVQK